MLGKLFRHGDAGLHTISVTVLIVTKELLSVGEKQFFFYSTGKFFELPYRIKNPSGQDRTTAERNHMNDNLNFRNTIL